MAAAAIQQYNNPGDILLFHPLLEEIRYGIRNNDIRF